MVVIAGFWRVMEGCLGRCLVGEVFLCEGCGGHSRAQDSKFIFLRQHKHRRLDMGGSGGYLGGVFFKYAHMCPNSHVRGWVVGGKCG